MHDKDSCEFGRFFVTTPQDLITDGLYKMVAIDLLPPPHDAVSAVHLARAVGGATGKGKPPKRSAQAVADRLDVIRSQRAKMSSVPKRAVEGLGTLIRAHSTRARLAITPAPAGAKAGAPAATVVVEDITGVEDIADAGHGSSHAN